MVVMKVPQVPLNNSGRVLITISLKRPNPGPLTGGQKQRVRNQERTAGTVSLGPSWLRRNHQIFSKYLLFSPPQGPNPQADGSRGGDTPAGTRPFPVTHT